MNLTLKLNGIYIPVKHFTFSGGEEQVKIETQYAPKGGIGFVNITAKLQSSSDVMSLVMLADAVRRLPGVSKDAEYSLYMPYIPYARQDRVMNPGESLAIKAFANIINSLNFDVVEVDDPHSDVSSALFDKIKINTQEQLFLKYVSENPQLNKILLKHPRIIAPDAGARKKAQKVADMYKLTVVEAGKVRDVSTGEITGTEVYGDVTGFDCIMVDDLCDGGRTFISLAQALKRKGAKRVSLYVTHGIFSYGKQVILDGSVDEIHAYHDDWTLEF